GAFSDDTRTTDAGGAYLFDTSGKLLKSLYSLTGQAGAQFGWSVAFAGNDPLVGAPHDIDNGLVFLFDDATGRLLATLSNPEPQSGYTFGYSVAASGVSNIVVGAPRASETLQYSGAAYFFGGRSSVGGSVWSDLNNDGIRQSAEFGIAGVTVTLTGTDLLGNPV